MADSSAEHRRYGKQCFNAAWDLIERPDRSADDDREMLLLAASSCWHWSQVGGAEEIATGEWQVSHVASLLGYGEMAQRFAGRALERAESERWDGWRLASMHEGMARACAVNGDEKGRTRHFVAAEAALEREPNPAARRTIEEQLATIP